METQRLPRIDSPRARSVARPPTRANRAPKRRSGRANLPMALGLVGVAALAMLALVVSGRLALPASWSVDGIPFLADPPAGTTWTAEVATDVLNVRDSASMDASVIASLDTGQRLTVTGGNIDGFVPVTLAVDGSETRGWVAVAYLQPIDGSAWAVDPDHGAALDGSAPPDNSSDVPSAGDPGESDQAPAVAPESTAEPTVPPTLVPTVAPTDVPTTESAAEPTGEHWIDVDRTASMVTLYVGDTAVAQFPALIGRDPSPDGFYSTAVGTFHVFSMDAALASTPFVDDVYLSDWVGFDPVRKNGFHSPVRNADGSVRITGGTETMGCVRLGEDEAKTLYAFAEIGMRVEIHD